MGVDAAGGQDPHNSHHLGSEGKTLQDGHKDFFFLMQTPNFSSFGHSGETLEGRSEQAVCVLEKPCGEHQVNTVMLRNSLAELCSQEQRTF